MSNKDGQACFPKFAKADRDVRISNQLIMKSPGPARVALATLYAFGNGPSDVVITAIVNPFIS